MPKVIVTGGAGYVGSHVCKALFEAGYTPITLDDLSKGHKELVQFGPLEIGDVRDEALLTRCFTQHAPCAVIHCAARAEVAESVLYPALYDSINAHGTRCLLNVMRRYGVKILLLSSSASVYGQVEGRLPISEETPLSPTHPYGHSKWMAEQLCLDAHRTVGLIYGFLRYFNAAGADASGMLGEWHEPETHLIPLALQTACKKREVFSLFGDDYQTLDGSAIRDYVHVTDLASAHLKALQSLLAHGGCLTLNLGAGKGYSVKQVLQVVQEVTGSFFPISVQPRRPHDPSVLVADIRRASQCLDWQPKASSLENIILTAWRWSLKNNYA